MNTRKHKSAALDLELSKVVDLHEVRHRKNTRGVNHALLQQLNLFLGRNALLSDITEQFCLDFASHLLRHVTVSSARTYMHKLHSLLEHAVSCRFMPCNPMPSIGKMLPRNSSPQRTFLTVEEVVKLECTPCPHSETKRAFLFACQTGMRLSDIETLKWSEISGLGNSRTIVKTQVKTGQVVSIPLNSIALKLLGKVQKEGLVFDLMSRSVISTDLRQWAKDAGIDKNVTFHVSRHTFATLSITAGVDIYVVSKLCGHTAVKTTEIYAHMVDRTLKQGVTKLCKVMRQDDTIKSKTWLPNQITRMNCLKKEFMRLKKRQPQ